ncbi:MAG: sigma 54-interacting transcriptional regulator [Desulfovibrio sp.]|nr:sigma 54-interacting transcriptional regulator [Desulfovibrio sp.]
MDTSPFQVPAFLALTEQDECCACAAIFDLIQTGIMLVRTDGGMVFINKALSTMFGIDRRQAAGSNICDFFPSSALLPVMRNGTPQKRIRFTYNGRDALISRYPVWSGDKVIGGLVEVYFRDIDEIHSLLSRIETLEERAKFYQKRSVGLSGARYTFEDIIGRSAAVRALKEKAHRFAKAGRSVLITGESGTGKELVAHAIHASSSRSDEVLICVNCAAIPSELIEAELFGYEGGAFTGARRGGMLGKFELADKGTIFLDEISELPLPMQAKLLRVLEQGEIQKLGAARPTYADFRVIAATNKELAQMAGQGLFREDLYHRLSALELRVPPLRERMEDVPQIAAYLLANMEEVRSRGAIRFDPAVLDIFRHYRWPGNVRELGNVLTFAVFSLEDGCMTICVRHLPPRIVEDSLHGASLGQIRDRLDDAVLVESHPTSHRGTLLERARDSVTRDTVVAALERCGGNKSRAAKEIGISRTYIYRLLEMFGIPTGGRSSPHPHP